MKKPNRRLMRQITVVAVVRMLALLSVACSGGASAAGPPGELDVEQRIERLIRKLGDDEFVTRERAESELGDLGLAALDALAKAQFDDDVEIAVRARRLLHSIQVRWISDRDSKDVRRILDHYGELPPDQRRAAIDELARLPNAGGFPAIARIARYDPFPQVAKFAALALLQAAPPDARRREAVVADVRRTLGRSKRESVRWVRSALEMWQDRALALDVWSEIVQRESTTYVVHPEQSGRDVLRALLLAHVDILLAHDREEEARQTATRVLPLVQDDRAQLMETADWLLRHQWPDLMESLYARFHDAFQQNTALLFRLAESRRRAGDSEASNAAAQAALARVSANGPKAVWLLGMALQNDGFFHWAEFAYRELTDVDEPDWKEVASVSVSLAEMLHELERDQEAATALEKLVTAARERPLKTVVERETRQPIAALAARAAYFQACHYGRQHDREAQHAALERSLELAPDDADSLIGLYRWAEADPDERAKVVERIRQAVGRYRSAIEAARRRANAARSRLERMQAQVEIAQQCNRVAWLIANTEGDLAFAIDCAEEAVRQYPDSAGIRDTLALCYFSAGRIDQAIQEQRKALEQEPHSPPLKNRMAKFLRARAQEAQ